MCQNDAKHANDSMSTATQLNMTVCPQLNMTVCPQLHTHTHTPASGLIHALGNKVSREGLLKAILRITRVLTYNTYQGKCNTHVMIVDQIHDNAE